MDYLPHLFMTGLVSALGFIAIDTILFDMALTVFLSRRAAMLITGTTAIIVMIILNAVKVPGLPGWLMPAMVAISLTTLAIMSYFFGEPKSKPEQESAA